MFIDTSAVVAILAGEDDAAVLATRLAGGSPRYVSALVILEAAMRLSSLLSVQPDEAEASIREFLEEADIEIMAIGSAEAAVAVQAFARYGKGRGHPARLNLADCLSYACARNAGVPLLYKGGDFARTDLA